MDCFDSPEFADVIKDYFNDSDDENTDTESTTDYPEPADSYSDESLADDERPSVKVDLDPQTLDRLSVFATNAGGIDRKADTAFKCCCKFSNGQPCSQQFTTDELHDLRNGHQTLSKDELDLVGLAHIRAGIHTGKHTQRPKQKEQTERKRVRVDYHLNGGKVCRDTFMFAHAIFKDRLTNLISHFQEHGVTPRIHGNKNRAPPNALTFQQRLDVVTFINNYAEQHAILLPGRIPGYKRDDLNLLPTSCTKASVYDCYVTASAAPTQRVVSQSSFFISMERMPATHPFNKAINRPLLDLPKEQLSFEWAFQNV